MSNKCHMAFTLQGGEPLDLQDLARQLQEGKPVMHRGKEVGRTHSATAQPNAIEVVIQLFTPLEIPPVKDLHLLAVPKDTEATLGSSLTVQAVEAKTEGT